MRVRWYLSHEVGSVCVPCQSGPTSERPAYANDDPHVAADALTGALAQEYLCEQPGDAEVLQRIGYPGGNALENLLAAGAVPPGDLLPVALMMLSALAQLCQSGSASLLMAATSRMTATGVRPHHPGP